MRTLPRVSFQRLIHALVDCAEFLSDQSDVEDGDEESGPQPNRAMRLRNDIEPLIEAAEAAVIAGREVPLV